jgi:peptidoglycan/LPS O-acetylase OafA/YrhL
MRERFLVLDGMRGIAALAVFWAHLLSHPIPIATQSAMAVDFFFLLSGFVIAHAYEDRLRSPGGFTGFVRDRVIRLHPLLLLSIVPRAIPLLTVSQPTDRYPLLTVLAAPIPFPAIWRVDPLTLPFPLNPPSWSLFWELIANLLFALVAPRISTRWLLAATVLLIAARLGISAGYGVPNVGDLTAVLRALPSFAAGMLLYRWHREGRLRVHPWIGALAMPVLIATLLMPGVRGGAIWFPLILFAVYPLILAGGAARQARFPRLCALFGGMSYPLYILHVPLLQVLAKTLGPPVGVMMFVEPLLCLAIVWFIWRLYDEPLRAWLRRHFGSRGHRQPDLGANG